MPVVSGLKRISKPGLRVYAAKTDIPRVLGGLGVVIVSTSQGIMTGAQARKGQLGGESPGLRLVGRPCHVSADFPSRSRPGVDITIDGSHVAVKGPKGSWRATSRPS